MYLIIAYHGKGKQEVDEDLKKLWFNFSNFVKFVKVRHVYFFQNAKDEKGADLLMIVDYKCARDCFDASDCSCNAGAAKQTQHFVRKNKNVNYWLYVREPKSLDYKKQEGKKYE